MSWFSRKPRLTLPNLSSKRRKLHRFGEIWIDYRPNLDGNGRGFALPIVDFFKRNVDLPGGGRKFERAYEWCCGPGFIGFALLAKGLVEHLVLADINPKAIDCVKRTVKRNKLEDRVSYYLGDSLDALPASERFDLVVGNPPWFYAINPDHPVASAFESGDLRPEDKGWKLHERFYGGIGKHLTDDGLVCISETGARDTVVMQPGFDMPWDVRPRPPIEDWRRQMEAGGLHYVDLINFPTPFGFDGEMVISSKSDRIQTVEMPGWDRRTVTRV